METLIERIQRHEGFCQFPKLDVAPMYVIGYGHDISLAQTFAFRDGIEQAQALQMLNNDIASCKDEIARELPWALDLDQIRYEVIVEMAFQMGTEGVSEFPKMIAAIQNKDYTSAAKEMLKSQWHSETPDRCAELANLMLYGADNVTH